MSEGQTGNPSAVARADALRARFEALPAGAGSPGPVRLVRAPGRVNLIGEHTDYNQGLVLPAAIDREIWIAFRPWDRPEVELTSAEFGDTRSFSLEGLSPETRGAKSWIDYVAATAWAMREAGLGVRGFRGVMDSTIPIGSGLSSSAALEMASTWALAVPRAPRPEAGAMAAIAQDGIAVVEATPAALAGLAVKADAVRAWCAKGNWLMLWGGTDCSFL